MKQKNKRSNKSRSKFFGVEYISKENREFMENKNIADIYRIQAFDAIMCWYLYIGFIDFILKGKSLLKYTNLFSSISLKKTLSLFIVSSKCSHEYEKIFKEE